MRRVLKKWIAGTLATAMAAVMALGVIAAVPINAQAAALVKKDVDYEGYGKVEVEFTTRIQTNNLKITVKDSSGKSYKVKNIKADDDEIKFRIWNFKHGEKYKFTITGIRKAGCGSYGKVTGSVKIPKTKVSERKAVKIAIADAVKKYKVKESALRSKELDFEKYKGKKVYEVELKFTKNGRRVEYEYLIDRTSGKILRRKVD